VISNFRFVVSHPFHKEREMDGARSVVLDTKKSRSKSFDSLRSLRMDGAPMTYTISKIALNSIAQKNCPRPRTTWGSLLMKEDCDASPPPYSMMTTFMLHGVRVKVRGRVGEVMVVVVGSAQVLVPTGSGKTPVGEPDRS
jgi:hypothetical protein